MSTPALPDMSQPGAQAAPNPHAGLMRMIQGLAVGLDSFASSAATQGREGGVEEVQRYQAHEQEMQQSAQASQREQQRFGREQQESDLRMKTMNAQLLMNEAAYHHALQMYPAQEKEANLKVLNDATASYKDAMAEGYDISDPTQAALWRNMQQSIISIPFSSGQSQSEVLSTVKDAASKNGKDLTDFIPLTDYTDGKHGTGGTVTLIPSTSLDQVKATPQQLASGLAQMKATLSTATTALGKEDPDVKALSGKLDTIQSVLDKGGSPSAGDFLRLNRSVLGPLSTRIAAASQTVKMQKEQSEAEKAKTDAIKSAQEANPQFVMKMERAKAEIAQAVKDGDPNKAADLLGQGLVAPSELISTRNPAFAQKAFTAAAAKYPGYNPQKAEADFHVAKSEDNTKFFGAANSLLGKAGAGGSLDILAQKHAALDNVKVPLLNKVDDYAKAAAGDPALAGFMQAVQGVADDYAKVMGGGTATDSGRLELLHLFSNAHNPAQMKNAIDTAKQMVSSQTEARIGNNNVLRQMYGGGAAPAAPADDFFSKFGGKKK